MRQPAPQWVNSLAIVLSGIAMLAPSISPYFRYRFINFMIASAILGFFWPERSWRWGLWLAVPVATLGLVNFANSMGIAQIFNLIISVGQVVIAGALPGLLCARFSPRRLPFEDLR